MWLVSEELKCETADVAAHKQHIKDLASRLLVRQACIYMTCKTDGRR